MQVEKIHEIQARIAYVNHPQPPPPLVGVVNPRAMRILAFLVITLSVVGCATVGILACWVLVPTEHALRMLWTGAIATCTALVLVWINEGFGASIRR